LFHFIQVLSNPVFEIFDLFIASEIISARYEEEKEFNHGKMDTLMKLVTILMQKSIILFIKDIK
jgi:hypothetical protein